MGFASRADEGLSLGGSMIVRSRTHAYTVCLALVTFFVAQPVAAFCGFYVAGADTKLYANATMVVLFREGTRTVLSMQNNYEGPPEAFALVIPVPSILQKDQVQTLERQIFAHVDALGSPRLVEYWEQNPCNIGDRFGSGGSGGKGGSGSGGAGGSASAPGVTIEASFAVAEYDILILSASDSSSLETWLIDNDYRIPAGAADLLMPYVADGMKFFVAKVDPERLELRGGQVALSPLRFYYDSPEFMLPIRLGLANSRGQQDLIVNIIARDRYEVANHDNVTIPTNIRVHNEVRDDFGGFYEALFARVHEKHAGAVVTEYAWGAQSCDPCPPGASLSPNELATLGLDVVGTSGPSSSRDDDAGISFVPSFLGYTLTRLHYRYDRSSLGEDLVFRAARPIEGGRGVPDRQGQLSSRVYSDSGFNNFQGRYAILHPWSEPVDCSDPARGFWGGPPEAPRSSPTLQNATNTALVGDPPQAGRLPGLLAQSLTALDVVADNPLDPLPPLRSDDGGVNMGEPTDAAIEGDAGSHASAADGCACSLSRRSGSSGGPALRWIAAALVLGGCALRRRRLRA